MILSKINTVLLKEVTKPSELEVLARTQSNMNHKTIWLVAVFIAAVSFNAYWNHSGRKSSNLERSTQTAVRGNIDIAFAALEAKEFEFAFNEFTMLAQSGSADAQLVLATMYKRGEGVAQSYEAALSWYYAAALQNNGVALAALGAMFVDGKGVKPDLNEAYKWYFLASQNEVPFSSAILEWIEEQLSELAVSEAKKLAEQCIFSNFKICALDR